MCVDPCSQRLLAVSGTLSHSLMSEYLHYTTIFLLRNKSEVADKFAKSVAFAETQTGKVVKALRCDNSGEYTSSKMAKFYKRRGIE